MIKKGYKVHEALYSNKDCNIYCNLDSIMKRLNHTIYAYEVWDYIKLDSINIIYKK